MFKPVNILKTKPSNIAKAACEYRVKYYCILYKAGMTV